MQTLNILNITMDQNGECVILEWKSVLLNVLLWYYAWKVVLEHKFICASTIRCTLYTEDMLA